MTTGYRIVWTTPHGQRRMGTQVFDSMTAACIEAETINALMDEAYMYTIEAVFITEATLIEEDDDGTRS